MNPGRVLAANITANIFWTGGAINLALLPGSHTTVTVAAALTSIAAAGGIGIVARIPR
jgi:hypothetical protein